MRKKILVVEDDFNSQAFMRAILKELGYTVFAVSNGRDAVEAVTIASFDMVFMDCNMPEMDGLTATKEIRQRETSGNGINNPPSTHIPIVALTAMAMTGDRERCLNAGMDDYLSKPVSIERLDGALKKWIH